MEQIDLSKDYKKRLLEIYNEDEEQQKKWLDPKYSFKDRAYPLFFVYENKAWVEYLINSNISKTKQNFNNCALIDCERIERFNVRLFDYGRTHVLYCALSDNRELINRYSQLNYEIKYISRGKEYITSYRDFVEQGEDCIYCDLMIKAMNRDMDGLAHNLRIVEDITLKKKSRQWMQPDYEFFKAILNKDKDKAFKFVEFISSIKQHNSRNREDILKKHFVSQPGMGFAKIAWINELEIEPTSDKIFKDLLPIKPLKIYENPIEEIIQKLERNDKIDKKKHSRTIVAEIK